MQGAINRISVGRLHPQDCVTASSDGSCIIWDLTTLKRKCMMSANAFFKDAAWSSDESQLVTAGVESPACHAHLSSKPVSIIHDAPVPNLLIRYRQASHAQYMLDA